MIRCTADALHASELPLVLARGTALGVLGGAAEVRGGERGHVTRTAGRSCMGSRREQFSLLLSLSVLGVDCISVEG